MASTGAELMVETLRELEAGTLRAMPQDSAKATLAPLLKKEDGRIDFARPAQAIYNRLCGFTPWPGAFTLLRGKQLRILKARALAPDEGLVPPGRIRILGQRLLVGCGQDTSLELLLVQPEGKRGMSSGEFINGYRLQGGEKLGE
jgi:methionyl-tRNA formyltransferase